MKLLLGPHYRYMEIEQRQESLQSNFHFICNCKPCTLEKSCNSEKLKQILYFRNVDSYCTTEMINTSIANAEIHMRMGLYNKIVFIINFYRYLK